MKCDKCGKDFSERVFGIHIVNCKPKAKAVQIEEKPAEVPANAEEAKVEEPSKAVTPAKAVQIEEKPAEVPANAEEAKVEEPSKAVTPAKPVKPAGKAKNE